MDDSSAGIDDDAESSRPTVSTPPVPEAGGEAAPASDPRLPRASEELRLVLSNAPVALWAVDRELRFTHTRFGDLDTFRNYLHGCVGLTVAQRVGTDQELEPVLDAHRRALKGECVTTDLTLDGRVFQAHLEPMHDAAGDVIGVVGVAMEVTEQRRDEAALRESEDRYRRLIELSPEGIAVHSEGRFLFANAATAKVLDVGTPEALEGRAIMDFVAPDARALAESRLRLVYAGHGPTPLTELRLLRADGSTREVELTSCPITYQGRPAVLTASRDVTARNRAERALREKHALMDAIARGATDAIWVKNLEGRYLLMNEAGARAAGVRPEDVVGRRDADLYPPETARMFEQHDRAVIATGETRLFEETTVVGGERRTWQATKGVYRGASGEPLGVLGISRDITELRHLEEQLRQSQKLDAVGRLAGGIAHDFNNLLAIIKSYSDFLLGSLEPDDARRDDVGEIRAAVDRAAALTRQLLVFSRKQVLTPRPLDLGSVVSELERMLRRLVFEGIELRTDLAADLWLVLADASQIEQLLLNLAVNARDAMPDGGTLVISAGNATIGEAATRGRADLRAGDYVVLSVRDSGIGMDAETASHIFEPFFTTKPPGKGTGLGLSTVYAIVEGAGGAVDVTTAPGEGTTISLYFPRLADGATRPPAAARAGTVLLVQHDPATRERMRETLSQGGYHVLVAADGVEAMRIARTESEPIDLLLADTLMPAMSGSALARYLTMLRPATRVLLVSAGPTDATMERRLTPPNAHFLQRNAGARLLLEEVRAALAAPPAPATPDGVTE